MPDQNHVYFKATKDSIIVMMDKSPVFGDIKDALKLKVAEARRFFGTSSTSVTFKGRELSRDEERELVSIITEGTDLKISTIEQRAAVIHDNQPIIKSVVNETIPLSKLAVDRDTIFHRGSLRSGMAIEHSGSVVVVGDINPGGEIVAGGNIVVLGTLKGLAHAGAFGNTDSFVAAISLQPTQLRIANIITSVAEELTKNKKSAYAPSYAYIHNGQIYIAPLV